MVWCNGYHHRKWTLDMGNQVQVLDRLFAFQIALIPSEKV